MILVHAGWILYLLVETEEQAKEESGDLFNIFILYYLIMLYTEFNHPIDGCGAYTSVILTVSHAICLTKMAFKVC